MELHEIVFGLYKLNLLTFLAVRVFYEFKNNYVVCQILEENFSEDGLLEAGRNLAHECVKLVLGGSFELRLLHEVPDLILEIRWNV